METAFRRISVVGAGLIGGSWGLALKRRGFKGAIVAYDRPPVLERALALGAIDEGAPSLAGCVREADLVILAAPVVAIVAQLAEVRAAAPTGALVTDTGSTKRAVMARAREVFAVGSPLFLGGHPLAGREQSGIENASADLFEQARYVLTPLAPEHLADPRAAAFVALVRSAGAEPFVTGAAAHDRALAYLSHLPQLLATALAGVVAGQERRDVPLELAAAGFRDMTRLAESPYTVWEDVCASNADNLAPALEAMIRKLEAMKLKLGEGGLEAEFDAARRLRAEWRSSR